MNLVEFVTAQLDEAERLAKAVDLTPDVHGIYQQRRPDGLWDRVTPTVAEFYVMRVRRASEDGYPQNEQDHPATALLAYYDPAFVLADIAAKRQIVVMCAEWMSGPPIKDWEAVDREADFVLEREVGPQLLKLLALPFADRPGYDEAWRP